MKVSPGAVLERLIGADSKTASSLLNSLERLKLATMTAVWCRYDLIDLPVKP